MLDAVTVLVRPGAWLVATFVAGGAAGAAGLHWITSSDVTSSGTKSGDGHDRERVRSSRVEEGDAAGRSEGSPSGPAIDRDALRAALAELLAEETASAEREDDFESEGMSASEALMRLEREYRAQLEEQERRAQEEALPATSEAAESAVDREVEEAAERHAVNAPFAGRGDGVEDRAQVPAEAPAVLARADGHEDARRSDDARASAEPVDGERVAVVTQFQPLFFAPVPVPQPTVGVQPAPSTRSPLSKPMKSAHEQSPWSPIDYSRHHNPWAPTWGRRVP